MNAIFKSNTFSPKGNLPDLEWTLNNPIHGYSTTEILKCAEGKENREDLRIFLVFCPNLKWDIFTTASFDYNYQNPSVFCFFTLIRAIVLCSALGLQNLNLKRKTK